MAKLIVVNRAGEEQTVEGDNGLSVMEVIRDKGFDELLALCGGCCSCATCHVYVEDEAHRAKLGEQSEMEADMLEFAENVQPTSRLACQLKPFDGLRLRTPEEQF